MEYFTNDSHLIGFKLNKNKKFKDKSDVTNTHTLRLKM